MFGHMKTNKSCPVYVHDEDEEQAEKQKKRRKKNLLSRMLKVYEFLFRNSLLIKKLYSAKEKRVLKKMEKMGKLRRN